MPRRGELQSVADASFRFCCCFLLLLVLFLVLVLVLFVSSAAVIIVAVIAVAVVVVAVIAVAVVVIAVIAVAVVVVAPRHRRHLLLPLLPLDNLQILFPAVSTFQTDAHKRLLVIVLGQTVNVFLSSSWGRQ